MYCTAHGVECVPQTGTRALACQPCARHKRSCSWKTDRGASAHPAKRFRKSKEAVEEEDDTEDAKEEVEDAVMGDGSEEESERNQGQAEIPEETEESAKETEGVAESEDVSPTSAIQQLREEMYELRKSVHRLTRVVSTSAETTGRLCLAMETILRRNAEAPKSG
jgi:hypothetical protein